MKLSNHYSMLNVTFMTPTGRHLKVPCEYHACSKENVTLVVMFHSSIKSINLCSLYHSNHNLVASVFIHFITCSRISSKIGQRKLSLCVCRQVAHFIKGGNWSHEILERPKMVLYGNGWFTFGWSRDNYNGWLSCYRS